LRAQRNDLELVAALRAGYQVADVEGDAFAGDKVMPSSSNRLTVQ
jgi:hypothetical protein